MAIRTDFTAGEVLAAADLNDTFGSKLNLAGGKILQVVRATDATNRSTTSTSFVDASISVTITPQKSDSAILLLWFVLTGPVPGETIIAAITDNSNNLLSGAQGFGNTNTGAIGVDNSSSAIGYSTPATTSAVTYKGRFKSGGGGNVTLRNATNTGQLYAIEVSA